MGMCSRKKGELLLRFWKWKGSKWVREGISESWALLITQSPVADFSKLDSHECTRSCVHVPYQIKEKTWNLENTYRLISEKQKVKKTDECTND